MNVRPRYYYAGSIKVAMRTGSSTLNYLLGDHLGSNSITTNSSGVKNSEIRYMPWGTTRYTSGSSPTTFQYTGQRVEASLGLLFYNARWYDPTAGRFLQADSVVPGGAQGLDRYAHVGNNPLKYTDPSGYNPECGPDGIYCDNSVSDEEKFGIYFNGIWSDEDKVAALKSVKAVASKFGAMLGKNSALAWAMTFNHMNFRMGGCDQCDPGDVAGFTYGAHEIRFSGLSEISELRRINHVVHELGHAFKWLLYNKKGIDVYSILGDWRIKFPGFPDRTTFAGTENETGPNFGFGSRQNVFTWQQSPSGDDSEEFADQFLGWTFNRWESENGLLTADGQARSNMMSSNMPLWVNLATIP